MAVYGEGDYDGTGVPQLVPQAKYDFFSDTKTQPTQAMREFMVNAAVGDEQKAEDPTTWALEQRCATLLGQEAAVFVPSGTLCNEIALRVHCKPGDEVVCDDTAHIVNAEGGAISSSRQIAASDDPSAMNGRRRPQRDRSESEA